MMMMRTIGVVLVCAGMAVGQDGDPEFGDISLEMEEERGVYLRGAVLVNAYADADFQTSTVDETMEFDPAAAGSLAVGYHQSSGNKGFRVEGEISYEQTDAELAGFGEVGEIEFASIGVNGYFDLRFNEQWSWYIGGGLGGSAVEASGDGGTAEDDAALFAQIMSGAEYRISGPFSAYGGVRLRAYETIELEDEGETADLEGFVSFGLELGVMLRF